MEVAIPQPVTVLSSNLKETTYPLFDCSVQGPYNIGDKFYYGSVVFKVNTLPDWTDPNNPVNMVPVFNSGDTYQAGDAVFDGGCVNVITTTTANADLVQPENYANKATGPNKDTWCDDCRYTNLGYFDNSTNSWTQTLGTTGSRVRLSLYKVGTGWEFKMEQEDSSMQWSAMRFNDNVGSSEGWARSFNCFSSDPNDCYNTSDTFSIRWGGSEVFYASTAYTPASGQEYDGNNGKKYKIGANVYNDVPADYALHDYEVAEGVQVTGWAKTTAPAIVNYAVDGEIIEQQPNIIDPSSPYKWLGRHFIIRSGNLYMFTGKTSSYETVGSTAYSKVPVQSPKQLNFMSEVGVIGALIPFDGYNYTFVEQAGPLEFKLTILNNIFDTIALAGVLAETIDVVFKRADGTTVKEIKNYSPDTKIDKYYRAGFYPTTEIFTSEILMESGDYVLLTLRGTIVRLSTIMLATKIDAGFSNVSFTNEYIDYSPFEQQDGYITYVEGVKVNTYSGMVDLPITDYDQMNRLFMSMGGKTIIVNGSDSNTSSSSISNSVYQSTRLIGRVREFALQTSLVGKRIDETATYTFKIEADI